MTNIRNILAATDFSSCAEHAVQRAALLAREHNATLRLLHVASPDPLAALRERFNLADSAPVREPAKDRLAETVARIQSVDAIPEIRTGDVVEELLGAADHADMLVLGAYGNRPIRDALIGTTADRLLLTSRRPLLVVKQAVSGAYCRVLVALDFSLRAFATLEFAYQLAPNATRFIFHAYDCPGREALRRAKVAEEDIQRIHAEYRDQAYANLENIRKKASAPVANATFVVLQGEPKDMVSATAERYKADLIVMGKHSRSRVADVFLGGVTRRSLATSICDVVVVPDWPHL